MGLRAIQHRSALQPHKVSYLVVRAVSDPALAGELLLLTAESWPESGRARDVPPRNQHVDLVRALVPGYTEAYCRSEICLVGKLS